MSSLEEQFTYQISSITTPVVGRFKDYNSSVNKLRRTDITPPSKGTRVKNRQTVSLVYVMYSTILISLFGDGPGQDGPLKVRVHLRE